MCFSQYLASAALCALALPGVACANEDDDTIVITASGIEQPRGETGHAITVIDRDRLDQLQSATVADALRTIAGVAVAQRGPTGSQTSVFLRGGNSAQTLVLIDGVRVNDVSSPNGAFDFGALQTGNFDRIEVLRGANSVIWGSQAIGGVVSLTSLGATDSLTLRASAEGGQAGTWRTSANASGTSGALRGSFGASWQQSDGISALVGGTERDGFDSLSANGALSIDLSRDIAVDLRGFYARGRLEYDAPFGLGANALPVTRNRQWLGHVGLRAGLFGGRLINRISFSRTDIDRDGTDPVAFSFNNFAVSGQVDRYAYQGEANISNGLRAIFGIDHERTRTRSSFEGAPATLASNRVTSAYAQLIVQPIPSVTLTGGVRHDDYSDYGINTSLAANAVWSPNDGNTRLRASYAEGFRAPTLSEGQPPFGNPALRPETAENLDVGIEQRFLGGRAMLGLTWFRRTSDDLIAFSFATFRSENIDHARSKGVELELALRPTDRLDLRASFARTDAVNRTPGALLGKRLALRPQHSAVLTADWATPWRFKLGATLTLTGDSFDDAANRVRLDGYVLAGLRAALPLGAGLEAFGRVDNLFDEKYAVVARYSTFGRGAHVGVRWRR
jgi:vitamin B12 transporter